MTFLGGCPNPVDVVGVVDPPERAEDVAIRRQRRLSIDDPSAGGVGLEDVQNHLDPTGGLRMAEPGVVAEAARVGSHAQDGVFQS